MGYRDRHAPDPVRARARSAEASAPHHGGIVRLGAGLNTIVQGVVAVGALVVVALGRASPELGLLVALSAIGCGIPAALRVTHPSEKD